MKPRSPRRRTASARLPRSLDVRRFRRRGGLGRPRASVSATRAAIAIPAYDAGRTVGAVVRRALATGLPVFVIDDGSTDRTAEEAAAAGARVISHGRNLGKGRALKTAFDALFAEGIEAVVTLDADGQHPPEEIPAFSSRSRAAPISSSGRGATSSAA